MNKIGQITYKHLENEAFIKDGLITTKFAAEECANITEEMCIKFDKWKRYYLETTKDDYDLYLLPQEPMNKWYTVEELFQEFLKTL